MQFGRKKVPNIGVLLAVRPSLLPGNHAAVLDIESTVTGWKEAGPPIHIQGSSPAGEEMIGSESGLENDKHVEPLPATTAGITLDRLDLPTQELATTVRVPLGKPVLVGGLTASPDGLADASGESKERKQIYLILRADLVGESQP